MQNQNNELTNFDKLKAEVAIFTHGIDALVVKDQESSALVMDTARAVKSWAKKLEDKRDELVRPLNAKVKEINTYAKSIAGPLEKAEAHCKAQLRTWELHLEKQRQEAMRLAEIERKRLEAEAAAKVKADLEAKTVEDLFKPKEEQVRDQIVAKVEQERTAVEIQNQHQATVTAIQSQKVSGASRPWAFEVTEANRIPFEFMMVDEKKIREAIRNGVREISGVRIFQDTKISIR